MATQFLNQALGTALGPPAMGGLPKPSAPEKRIGPSPEDDLARADLEIEKTLKKREDLTTQLGRAITAKTDFDLKEKAFAADQQSEAAKKSKSFLDDLESKFVNSPEYKEYKSNADKTAEELTFKPSQENAQTLALVFSVISASGFLLGGLNKKNALSAMYAMNGLTEGYAKGREDLFKQERQTFETNVKAMQERMKVLKDKLDVGIKTLARDKERGELEIQAAMAEANADFLRSQKDARGVIATREILENQINQLDKALGFLKTAQERHRAQQLQGYWNQAKLDTQERLASATNERLAQQFQASQRAADERAAAAERRFQQSQTASESRFMRGLEERTSREQKPTVADERKNEKVMTLVQGVRSIESLQKQLRDPDIQTGLVAKASPLLERLKSLAPGTPFETAVNQTLTGTDKTTLFLKDALLETYAIESAAKGGQRLTVQDMKMVGPVLDPTNYTPQTYNALLDQRRKVLYDNLQDRGLTPKEIQERSVSRPYTPYGGGTPSPAPQPAAAQPSTGPYPDPDKERRYQDWKARQPK
jgi:hypothetical protein